jgi:hypothetical protein
VTLVIALLALLLELPVIYDLPSRALLARWSVARWRLHLLGLIIRSP